MLPPHGCPPVVHTADLHSLQLRQFHHLANLGLRLLTIEHRGVIRDVDASRSCLFILGSSVAVNVDAHLCSRSHTPGPRFGAGAKADTGRPNSSDAEGRRKGACGAADLEKKRVSFAYPDICERTWMIGFFFCVARMAALFFSGHRVLHKSTVVFPPNALSEVHHA
jgi:hypothetical protein